MYPSANPMRTDFRIFAERRGRLYPRAQIFSSAWKLPWFNSINVVRNRVYEASPGRAGRYVWKTRSLKQIIVT